VQIWKIAAMPWHSESKVGNLDINLGLPLQRLQILIAAILLQ